MRSWKLVPIVLAGLIAVPASGQSTKERKSKERKRQGAAFDIDVSKQKGRIKAKLQEAKDRGKQKSAPLTADAIIERENRNVKIRRAQILALRELCDDTPDSDADEKADVCFRLATIYTILARTNRFQVREIDQKLLSAPKSKQRALKAQQAKHRKAKARAVADAVKVYSDLVRNDNLAKFNRMDEVLFRFAITLEEDKDAGKKRMDQARQVFQRLIRNYPNSKYVPEAYLRFADYYFAQNSLANAEAFYNKVLKFPKSRVYNYAYYKKGWVYLNLGQHKRALKVFYDVAKRTERKKKEALLNRASKKDYVRAFAEAGDPTAAKNAFKRVDKEYMWTMMSILGDLYLSSGKAENAIYIYKTLIQSQPRDKRVCDWQWYIVQAVLSKGSDRDKAQAVADLVKLYTVVRDRKMLPAAQLQECEANAREITLDLGTFWHHTARKTKNWKMLDQVEVMYRMYIKGFPNRKDVPLLEYYYAELQWQRADNETNPRKRTVLWQDAAIAFTQVVEKGKVKQKLIKESAYASVLAWQNALIGDPRPPAQVDDKETAFKEGRIPKEAPIPERDQKMLKAFDVYTRYVKDPKDSERIEIRFAQCRVYYHYNHFKEAIPCLQDIIPSQLEHEKGATAAQWLLDAYKVTKQPDGVVKTVRALKRNKKGLEAHPELVDVIKSEERKALVANAEKIRDAAQSSKDYDQFVKCGDAYREIYNTDPNHRDSIIVLWRAGICYQQGRSLGAAISTFRRLRAIPARPKDSKFEETRKEYSAKALGAVGAVYGQVAKYDAAAERLEEYAKRYGGEKDAPDAMSDAILYRKGTGNDRQAIKNTYDFLEFKKVPKSLRAEAHFNLHYIYEQNGESDKVVKHLRAYLKDWAKYGGADRKVIAYTKMGQIYWRESCPLKTLVNGACIKVKRGRALLSKSKRKKRRRKGADIPPNCGRESNMKVRVIDRDRRPAKAAMRAFADALKVYKGGKAEKGIDDPGRINAMRRYAAAARFHQLDKEYEEFLALNIPRGLTFDMRKPRKKKKDEQKFGKWVKGKTKKMASLGNDYKKLIGTKGDGQNKHYKIAAAARVGLLGQNFTDQLLTTPVPAIIKKIPNPDLAMDVFDSYCSTLETEANKLTDITLAAYKGCLSSSTAIGWFNEWGRLCERELGQIRPAEFPTASELSAEPMNFAPITSVELPIINLAEVE